MVNRLTALNDLLSTKLKVNEQMVDHIAHLESQFSRLATMGSKIEEQMRVTVLLSSLS